MANNYKVPGTKMTSRFGYSHRETRIMNKLFGDPRDLGQIPMSKRLMKKCKHKRWIDDGYGNTESGGDGGHCKDCGYSFWHQYY
jgi:hypothetical protein